MVKPRDRAESVLCGGQYITRLANNLNLMTSEIRNSLTFAGYLDYIDRGLLAGMKLLVGGEGKGEYMWNQTPIQSDYSEAFGTPDSKGAEPSSSSRNKRIVEFDDDDVADSLADLSRRITELAIEETNNHNRLPFRFHNLQKEEALQTNAMAEIISPHGFQSECEVCPSPELAPSFMSSYWLFFMGELGS